MAIGSKEMMQREPLLFGQPARPNLHSSAGGLAGAVPLPAMPVGQGDVGSGAVREDQTPAAAPAAGPALEGGGGMNIGLRLLQFALGVTGIGMPFAALIEHTHRRGQAAEAAEMAKLAQSREAQYFARQYKRAGGDLRLMLSNTIKDPEFTGEILAENPQAMSDLHEFAKAHQELTAPQFAGAGTMALDPQTGQPLSGFQVPFAPPAQTNVHVENIGESEKAKLDAQYFYDPETGIRTKLEQSTTKLHQARRLRQLVEQASGTGTPTVAFKEAVRDLTGVDLGQNPTHAQLRQALSQVSNDIVASFTGVQAKDDVARVNATLPQLSNDQDVNRLLAIQIEAAERRANEIYQERLTRYELTKDSYGIEAAITEKFDNKPLFTAEEQAEIDKITRESTAAAVRGSSDFAAALERGDRDAAIAAFRGMNTEQKRALKPQQQERFRALIKRGEDE